MVTPPTARRPPRRTETVPSPVNAEEAPTVMVGASLVSCRVPLLPDMGLSFGAFPDDASGHGVGFDPFGRSCSAPEKHVVPRLRDAELVSYGCGFVGCVVWVCVFEGE